MGLRVKFNLMLLVAFLFGLVLAGFLSNQMLRKNAREEVEQNARIMIESALAVRGYTAKEIYPLIKDQLSEKFLPQTVSAYAAGQNMKALRDKFPDYIYKEAALNPTNPNDRASDWEADIINAFRNDNALKELIVPRDTPTGPVLNLARPLQIKTEGCLNCHNRPEQAPKTMIDAYGPANGFG
ncbi:MAG: DUF3365 domain-containing protein [Gammaproteobacteria bacterium]